jgi:hypothetical protein
MIEIQVETKRGVLLNGVLFNETKSSDTVLIAITGIHGNFYSNPFYYNIGYTLNKGNIDFIYAQTNDAFGAEKVMNVKTKKLEIIGSCNEDFNYTDEDIEAYLNFAEKKNYKHIYLSGHSLGANKIIYYLSRNHDKRVEKYLLLSPANITHLLKVVTDEEKYIIQNYIKNGKENEIIPFELLGWIQCTAKTAYNWVFNNILNNVHVEKNGDFSQINEINHKGAMLIGTYDRFTYGDPSGFLTNINNHTKYPKENKLIFIEKTGHTYQKKQQEVADIILKLIKEWREEN